MKHILLTLLFGLITAAPAANIVIMVVEDPNNYEAPRTMRDFAEKQFQPLGHQVTIIDGVRKLNDMLEGTKLPRLDVAQIEAMIHRDSLALLGLTQT